MSKRKCGCVIATAENTESVRSGHELGGYVKHFCDEHTPTPTADQPEVANAIITPSLDEQLRGIDDAIRAGYEARNVIVGSALSPAPVGVTDDDPDEAYELGKRDGYEEAVADIDRLTGGDGEYRFCTDHDPDRHTPDPETMKQRIADRFDALASHEPAPEPGEFGDGVTVEREDDSVVAKNATTASADKLEVVGFIVKADWTESGYVFAGESNDTDAEPLARLSDATRIITTCQQDVERLMGELIKSRNYWSGQCSDMIQRNAELAEALNQIYTLDFEDHLYGVSNDACRGLVARIGEIARAALKGQSNEA